MNKLNSIRPDAKISCACYREWAKEMASFFVRLIILPNIKQF